MFKRSSKKALTAIIMAMASIQIYIVESCETPPDAWKMQEHFEKGLLASKLHLKKRFFPVEMAEGNMVEKTLQEKKEWTDQLAAIGSPIAEEDQVMSFLGSLPSSYNPLVTTLGSQLDGVTWVDVEHAKIPDNKKGHSSSRISKEPHLTVKKSLECFCGRKGHFQRDCLKQKGNGKQKQVHDAKAATDIITGSAVILYADWSIGVRPRVIHHL